MTADTCGNGRRGNFITGARDGGAIRFPAREFSSTCPDCGRAMTRDTRNVRHLFCTSCGNEQQLDALGPTASALQVQTLHDRGLDRLLDAIGG